MSQSQHDVDDPLEGHESPIRTPKQLVATIVAAFVVPVIVIVLLVKFVTSEAQPGAGSEGLAPEAVAQRIQRVGTVEVKDPTNVAAMKTGEQVYTAQCSACHATGAAGAPKVGDEAAWAPRIKTGYEALLNSALKGKGAMAPQGGGDFSDLEIARAVVYLANKGGAKLEEPKAPAAGAATAKAGTAAPAAAPAAAAAPAPAAPAPAATPAKADAAPATGSAPPPLYAQACGACHEAGVAGAPKIGDKAAWAPRLAQGLDGLTQSVINGKGAMPPRGASAGSDADIKAVVGWMVARAK